MKCGKREESALGGTALAAVAAVTAAGAPPTQPTATEASRFRQPAQSGLRVRASSAVTPMRRLAAVLLGATLVACGGGGSDDAPAPAPAPLAIAEFTATPANVLLGQSVSLAWQTTGATSVAIDQGIGAVSGSSVTVTPALGSTTYELTASGGAASVRRSVSVDVTASATAPAIDSFTASAVAIVAGQSVTLRWSVAGATSLAVAPAPGVVTGASVSVAPTVSTVYTLTARNGAGATDSSVAVTVSAAPAGFIERQLVASATQAGVVDRFGPHVAVAPLGAAVGRLVVHLPGTGGKPPSTLLLLRQAGTQGLHGIGLAYPNLPSVDSLCSASSDVDCHAKVRLEIIDGTDRTPLTSVDRINSIENRLVAALGTLAAQFPAEGWGQFVASGVPRWDRIVVSGHSQGGGHAAMMARDRLMARVCMFGSPKDTSSFFNAPAAWQSDPHVTPTDRYYGFNHQQDSQAVTLRNWAALGLGSLGAAVNVDGASSPYAGSRQLTTNAVPALAGEYHGSVVVDRTTPLAADGTPLFAPVWGRMCLQ